MTLRVEHDSGPASGPFHLVQIEGAWFLYCRSDDPETGEYVWEPLDALYPAGDPEREKVLMAAALQFAGIKSYKRREPEEVQQ